MSATVLSDPMAISAPDSQTQSSAVKMTTNGQIEVLSAKCECCGLTEECTPAYISRIRERHQGRWICGLCAEAVKYEINRSSRRIGMEEALNRHVTFCEKFSQSAPLNPTQHLISAVRQVLRKSLDSPRGGMRSTPNSPRRDGGGEDGARRAAILARSESCLSTMSRMRTEG